jgi:hypothetical protein
MATSCTKRTVKVTFTLPTDVIQTIKTVSRSEDRNLSNALVQLVRRATANLCVEEPANSRG